MDLETRVATLEEDVASMRVRMDNADMKSDETRRDLADLRAETKGWAEIAVRAGRGAGAAAELMKLIYKDVGQIKETLDGHGARLDGIDAKLDGHGARLDGIDAKLDGHGARLDGIDAKLVEQGDLLRQILAKVS